MFLHNFLRRFLETNEDEVSRCLLEASDATSQQQFSPNAFASVHLDIKKVTYQLIKVASLLRERKRPGMSVKTSLES